MSSVDRSPHPRVHRIRGGDLPQPDVVPWRVRRRLALEAAASIPRTSVGEQLQLGRLRISLDGVLVFGLFLSMLLITEFGSRAAAVFVALVPIYVWLRRGDLLSSLLPRALLLIVPGLALFSVLWSEAPAATVKYAIQFGLTVLAALLLSSAKDQEAVLRGMAAAFLVYIVAALAVGRSVEIGVGAGGEAFSGFTDSKNVVADVAATGLLLSLVVGALAYRRRDYLWVAASLTAMLLDAYVLVSARSAGAILSVVAGLAALAALVPLVFMHPAVRAVLMVVVTTAMVFVGLSYRWISATLINLAADLFDKDPTLTGRTYLWYRARDLIAEKPLLGRGYFAFWLQGNTDAEGLWRYAGIRSRSGFTFHNSAVEILVGLGYAGLAVVAIAVAIAAVALAIRVVRAPTPILCFWVVVLLYQLSRAPIESVGMTPFYYSTVLIFAAMGAAFGTQKSQQAAKQRGGAVLFRPISYVQGRVSSARLVVGGHGSLRVRGPNKS